MPTANRESSRSRRSNSKAKSPPPTSKPPPKQNKVNGVSKIAPKSTKQQELTNSKPPPVAKNKPILSVDLQTETGCRLCDRKNFKLGTEALVKHYALDHFKEKLDAELGALSKDFSCNLCKNKKLKSKFESRQDLLLHNAGFHSRVQSYLSDEKQAPVTNNIRARSARVLNRDRGKQSGPGPGPGKSSEEVSNDSVIEIDSSSGSSEGSHNGEAGHNGLEQSSDIEEVNDDDDDSDDEIEFKPVNEVGIDLHKSQIHLSLART